MATMKKLFVKSYGCQMNVYDAVKMTDLLAPLGYGVAKVASTLVQAVTPALGAIGSPGDFFVRSLAGVTPGLLVLAVVGGLLVKFYPKTAGPAV